MELGAFEAWQRICLLNHYRPICKESVQQPVGPEPQKGLLFAFCKDEQSLRRLSIHTVEVVVLVGFGENSTFVGRSAAADGVARFVADEGFAGRHSTVAQSLAVRIVVVEFEEESNETARSWTMCVAETSSSTWVI